MGASIHADEYEAILTAPVSQSWCESITDAAQLEAAQWRTYEARFAFQHELALAHRYTPTTPEERSLVEKFFPPRAFGNDAVQLDCMELRSRAFEEPISLARIKSAEIKNNGLRLSQEGAGVFSRDRVMPLRDLGQERQAFLDAFMWYWNRARAAASYRAQREKRAV